MLRQKPVTGFSLRSRSIPKGSREMQRDAVAPARRSRDCQLYFAPRMDAPCLTASKRAPGGFKFRQALEREEF